MKVVANIDFGGDCREAFTEYARILGGTIRAMIDHHQMPGMGDVPGDQKHRILHAWIDIGDQALMGQDMQDFDGRKGMGVTISADNVSEGSRIFSELAKGGVAIMPFGPQPWSQGFGLVTDRFGVSWAIDTPAEA